MQKTIELSYALYKDLETWAKEDGITIQEEVEKYLLEAKQKRIDAWQLQDALEGLKEIEDGNFVTYEEVKQGIQQIKKEYTNLEKN